MSMSKHKGFRVLIHKDIPPERLKECHEFCDRWIQRSIKEGYGCHGGHGDYAFYRRRILGYLFSKDYSLTFRRLSTKRRIFGIVPTNLLFDKETGKQIVVGNGCVCASCEGGRRVSYDFNENNFILYFEDGNIKC